VRIQAPQCKTPFTTGASSAGRFFSLFGHPRPAPTLPPAGAPTSALTKQDGYSFFLGLGPLSNVNEKYFKNDVPFWTEMSSTISLALSILTFLRRC
jgi:hypothetical protein